MGLKPSTARWFEVLTPRDELARTVEALARTHAVELESERPISSPARDAVVQLERFREIEKRNSAHWPEPAFRAAVPSGDPEEAIARSLASVVAWEAEAEPLIRRKEQLSSRVRDLHHLVELGNASEAAKSALTNAASNDGQFAARVWAFPAGASLPPTPTALTSVVATADHRYALLVAPRADVAQLDDALQRAGGLRVEIPREVRREAPLAILSRERDELGQVQLQLDALARRLELPKHLANVKRLEWFLTRVPPLEHTRHFALVTGWTSELDAERMADLFERTGVSAIVRFPPPRSSPPVILRNPPWVRPFEALARLIGTPSSNEADPSVVLALLAPLLFGFMFADVGQGLVLLSLGLVLRRRRPQLALLVPGGAAAVLFGLLFGSVFAMEHVVPAVWLHPLSRPLTVLGASVGLGVAVLSLGFVLAALAAAWRGELVRWLATDGTLLVVYLGLLATFIDSAGLWAVFLAVFVHVGAAFATTPRKRLVSAATALGQLIERTLQLGVNTVSFARVGAFALAHAGLCVAVVELSRAPGVVGGVLVLVLGNALIVALEGLVVSVQTTRLVLFEFFMRFLRGEGRSFVPLDPPAPDGAMMGAHQ